jgi:hypothetical protein
MNTDQGQEDQKSTFQVFDDGTLFGGRHYWLNGDACNLMWAVGMWSWDDVHSVGSVPEGVMVDMPEPRCLLYWRDQYLYLQAHINEVQKAWRHHRKAVNVRHLFPFSGIVPFSGN